MLVIDKAGDRARIEEDLIRNYQPKMNDVLVPRGADDAPNNKRLRRWWRFKRMFRIPFFG